MYHRFKKAKWLYAGIVRSMTWARQPAARGSESIQWERVDVYREARPRWAGSSVRRKEVRRQVEWEWSFEILFILEGNLTSSGA